MKKFFDEEFLKEELDSLASTAKGDLNVLFDWYDHPDHNWQYGSQQRFLWWVYDEMGKQGARLGYDAVRKRYQRHQSLSPEQRLRRMNKKNEAEFQVMLRAVIENWGGGANAQNYGDFLYEDKVNQIVQSVHDILTVANGKEDYTYTLNRCDIFAQGIWVNRDWKKFLCQLGGNLTLEDVRQEIMMSGRFIVFANSQMKKTARSLGDKYKRIEKKREEIIESGILEEQEQFYVFRKNYAFSSPSLAASVLLGINVNGQVFWRDCRGRTFRELHQKFDKIKRGPGRPKKSS